MKEFPIKQNKKKLYIAIGCLMISALLCFFLSFAGVPLPGIFQTFGIVLIAVALLLFNNFAMGGMTVAINDSHDDISEFPKLYIYTVRGKHNITQNGVVIPFNKIISLEKTAKIKKIKGMDTTVLLANFKPQEAFVIKYRAAYDTAAVICDFGADAEKEISHRIELFAGLEDGDEF